MKEIFKYSLSIDVGIAKFPSLFFVLFILIVGLAYKFYYI